MNKTRIPLVVFFVVIGSLFLSACGATAPASSWPGVTVNQDVAYVAYNSFVHAVRLSDGTEIWRYPQKADAKKAFYAAPAVLNGQVVDGDYANVVISMNAADGTEKWTFAEAKDRYVGAGLVIGDVMIFPNVDHNVYALNQNGARQWVFKTSGPVWAQPVTDGKTVFIASMDKNVYAVNPQDGSKIWEQNVGSAVIYSLGISDDKSMIFAGTIGNKFVALDAASGKIVWQIDTTGNVWSFPVQHENTIFFGDQTGKIYARSVKDGSKVFEVDAGGPVVGAGAVMKNGVAFPVESGSVKAVDFKGGNLWNQAVNGTLYSNLIYTGDRLLVPVTNGKDNLLLAALNDNGTTSWPFAPK